MLATVFKDTSYNLQSLISKIDIGEIGLPDIQRPFVWKNTQARDLFDSMYKGFPVGHLLFWQTGADSNDRKIGSENKQSAPILVIVDGQQRLTALFSVIAGQEIVNKDYTKVRIKIAFNPSTERFEVTNAAIVRDPEFVPDIFEVFKDSFHSFQNNFLENLEKHRGKAIDEKEQNLITNNLVRLRNLQSFTFKVIELDKSVDEERAAEIFVRMNSKGIQLKTSDFILTLMSVFWEEGRKDLENFCRAAKNSSINGDPSPYNHFIAPAPEDLLRAGLGLAFKKAKMKDIYSLLRGKDIETGNFDPSRKHKQFEILSRSQKKLLNLTDWHEFLECLTTAGFRSRRMISSDNAVMFTYMHWMLGKDEFNLDPITLRHIISQWWFMVHTMGRYTGSFETMAESDLNKIKQLPLGNGEVFCNLLSDTIGEAFTNDYWEITFPIDIDSTAHKTPPLSAYWAALNILDAEMLFSGRKISTMLDPAVTPIPDIKRHPLFPTAYFKDLGETERYKIMHIANLAFVDWGDDDQISKQPPKEYWPKMIAKLSDGKLKQQMFWHALPENWEQMEYSDFLQKRRSLIAKVVREAFGKLSSHRSSSHELTLEERIANGESALLEFKQGARWSVGTEQKRTSEQIIVKTVAGFLNGDGGSLLIGVDDNGSIIGLERDYQTFSSPDRDNYERFLSQLISNSISGAPNALCKISFHSSGGKEICEIKVQPAIKPAFSTTKDHKEQHTFWCREGNRTVRYQGTDRQDYIDSHWQ